MYLYSPRVRHLSGSHNINAVLHRKTLAIQTQFVYQITLSDVMRTINSIETKFSAAI